MSNYIRLEKTCAALDAATKDIREYLNNLVDEMSFVELNAFAAGADRLNGAPIPGEGVLCGTATIEGVPVAVVAQNVAALYGSFGKAQANKICRTFELAAKRKMPVISILDSAGARVGEGVEMLEAYGAVLRSVADFGDRGLHFCIVKGQAVGLMAAFAQLADYRIAAHDAVLSVTAPAVLAARVGNASATSAASLAKDGYVDFVCKDVASVADCLRKLVGWYTIVGDSEDDPNREAPALAEDISAEALMAALADDGEGLEYAADRGTNARCFLAHVFNLAVGVVVVGGKLSENDCGKINCFACNLSDAGAALITLVNSEGFEDEKAGELADSMAMLTLAFSDRQPKIAVCVGNAIGNAYTMLASKGIGFDYSLAFVNACISPVAPDAAVHLVYADVLKEKGNSPEVQAQLAELYRAEHCDAFAAAQKGYVDAVIDPATLRPYVANALGMLGAKE